MIKDVLIIENISRFNGLWKFFFDRFFFLDFEYVVDYLLVKFDVGNSSLCFFCLEKRIYNVEIVENIYLEYCYNVNIV